MNQALWKEIKKKVKQKVGAKPFEIWITPLVFKEQKGNTIVIEARNKFVCHWIEENFSQIIKSAAAEVSEGIKITIVAGTRKREPAQPDRFKESPQLAISNIDVGRNGRRLNGDYTFERFATGRCNELAYAAARVLVEESGSCNNPLFIFAATGLGKTHLSQAIGNAILENNRTIKVNYVTSEEFLNDMVYAIKAGQMGPFKIKYAGCDVLILEEIHFMTAKNKTQEALGYTLDMLINEHKKIVLTSSLMPQAIPYMRKSLTSRLSSGIVARIDVPDAETRRKIIEQKGVEYDIKLPGEIVGLLAGTLRGDIRQIEGVLKNLKIRSELLRRDINPELAKEILEATTDTRMRVRMKDVEDLVCKRYKVAPNMLRAKSRLKVHVWPRKVYMYLCRQFTDETIETIGESVGRGHATVIYGSEAIEKQCKTSRQVKQQVELLAKELEGSQTRGYVQECYQ